MPGAVVSDLSHHSLAIPEATSLALSHYIRWRFLKLLFPLFFTIYWQIMELLCQLLLTIRWRFIEQLCQLFVTIY
jgi:hypothetical protein